jgi:hypothetical protein
LSNSLLIASPGTNAGQYRRFFITAQANMPTF